MKHPAYFYKSTEPHRYTFTSHGRISILKAVEFALTRTEGLYNMAFGDVLADGSIDDSVKSNNGDILKVLTTVVQIAVDFLTVFPDRSIVFAGSSPERTKVYARILKKYHTDFAKEFIISGLREDGDGYSEDDFDPNSSLQYFAFIIKRFI